MEAADREILALLSMRIASIMEDEVGQAVMALPRSDDDCAVRFASLRAAGRDIELLSHAAETILRRSSR